jgi:acid stress-induced BolA-like protein IbaG/YrbA
MLQAADIEKIITKNLDCDYVEVRGDDGTHFEAVTVSKLFKDLSKIKQHQLVYKALGDMMKQDIHALSMKTLNPEEWSR